MELGTHKECRISKRLQSQDVSRLRWSSSEQSSSALCKVQKASQLAQTERNRKNIAKRAVPKGVSKTGLTQAFSSRVCVCVCMYGAFLCFSRACARHMYNNREAYVHHQVSLFLACVA